MVADPLVEASDESKVGRDAGIGALGNTLAGEAGREVVELVVRFFELEGHVSRPLGVCGARELPHAHCDVTHRLDEAAAAGCDDAAEASERSLRDVLGQVRTPLQLGNDLSQSEQILELIGVEHADRDPVAHERGELLTPLVHESILSDHPVGELDVLVEKRSRCPAEALGHQREQPHDAVVDTASKLVAIVDGHAHHSHAIACSERHDGRHARC